MTFLLQSVIKNALNENKKFNFCGSSRNSIANYFEGFGGKKIEIPVWTKKRI